MQDMHNNVEYTQGFKSTTITNANTATQTGIIDRAGAAAIEFILNIGDLTDANATFAVTIEHGDASNLSDAAAPAASDLLGTPAGASFIFSDDAKIAKIGYIGAKRYLRLTVTPSGNDAGAATYACTVAKHYRRKVPQATQLVA